MVRQWHRHQPPALPGVPGKNGIIPSCNFTLNPRQSRGLFVDSISVRPPVRLDFP